MREKEREIPMSVSRYGSSSIGERDEEGGRKRLFKKKLKKKIRRGNIKNERNHFCHNTQNKRKEKKKEKNRERTLKEEEEENSVPRKKDRKNKKTL